MRFKRPWQFYIIPTFSGLLMYSFFIGWMKIFLHFQRLPSSLFINSFVLLLVVFIILTCVNLFRFKRWAILVNICFLSLFSLSWVVSISGGISKGNWLRMPAAVSVPIIVAAAITTAIYLARPKAFRKFVTLQLEYENYLKQKHLDKSIQKL